MGTQFTRWAIVFAGCLLLAATVRTDDAPTRLVSQPPAAGRLPIFAHAMVGATVLPHWPHYDRFHLDNGISFFANQQTLAKITAPDTLRLERGGILLDIPVGKKIAVQAPDRKYVVQAGQAAIRTTDQGSSILVVRGSAEADQIKLTPGQQLPAGQKIAVARSAGDLNWSRDLIAAAAAPLVPASKRAGGELVVADPNGQEAKLTLRKFHLDVHIEDGFARTTIDQAYFNQEQVQLEGTFFFPLPADASLSRLAMYVDGKLMEGGIVERNYGRQVYETIRYANRDPALLEWVDGTTFKMRVFPLEPRTEKRILLCYTQRLPGKFHHSQYRFPAGHDLHCAETWSADIRVKDARELDWVCPSHPLKGRREGNDLILEGRDKKVKTNRDLVLELTDKALEAKAVEHARFSMCEHDGAKYLMLRYRPKLVERNAGETPAQESGKRAACPTVFLFESSGDRDPLLARAQIEIIRHLLQNAAPKGTFLVAAANTRLKFFDPQPRSINTANIEAAIAFLEKSHLIGALDVGHAFDALTPILAAEPGTTLIHLGSGMPALGERRIDVLAGKIPASAHYVGVGVGRRWNRGLMQAAAERTSGFVTQMNPDEQLPWRAFELATMLDAPRLLNVRVVALTDDPKTAPRFLVMNPLLANGEELCAVARIDSNRPAALPKSVRVTGALAGQPFSRDLPVKTARGLADYLPRTWARLEIDCLLADNAEKHLETIINLSKAMYVVTPFTSLLVLEHEDLYVQYKVDRGRKDHWAMYTAPMQIPVVYEPLPGEPDPRIAGKKPTVEQVVQTISVRGKPLVMNRGRSNALRQLAEDTRNDWAIGRALNQPLAYSATLRDFGNYAPIGFGSRIDLDGTVPGFNMNSVHLLSNAPMGGFGGPGRSTNTQPVREMWGHLHETPRIVTQGGPGTVEVQEEIAALMQVRETHTGSLLFGNFGVGRVAPELRVEERSLPNNSIFLPKSEPGELAQEIRLVAVTDPFLARVGLGNDLGTRESNFARANLPAPMELDLSARNSNPLIYGRPSYGGSDRIFYDLVAYAPGLNTSGADLAAIIDAEARPQPIRNGTIDAAARKLIDESRKLGWRTLRFDEGAITFDGAGRYVMQRTLPPGITERAFCDGKTLTHVYPQLFLAAERTVSRHHRAELGDAVPCWLPPADDLAHGAEITLIAPRTIGIVPHRRDAKAPWLETRFVFGDQGQVRERQLVLMPKNDVFVAWRVEPNGELNVVRGARLHEKGASEPLTIRVGKLENAAAPNLVADVKNLLVVPMPYRSADHVKKSLKLENKSLADLRFADALPLFLAHVGAGNANEAQNVFRTCFANRNQRQLGFYVLLAACGANLDSTGLDVLAEHIDEPLAQYLALHTSPVLRKHASQWAVGSGSWQEGFLQHLATAHALIQRWQNAKEGTDPARLKADRAKALAFVNKNANAYGWSVLGLLQDQAGKDKAFQRDLAEAYGAFEKLPGWSYFADYEKARCLWHAGNSAKARELFERIYRAALAEKRLPPADRDLQRALLGGRDDRDLWNELLREAAQTILKEKNRPAVLALAWQCWQLDDQPLAMSLFAQSMEALSPAKEGPLLLAGVRFLMETGQYAQADEMVVTMLADPKWAKHADLWRLGATLAEKRDLPHRQLECLEKALDAEFRNLPEKFDLKTVQREYGQLLEHYQKLADAMVTLKLRPEPAFLAKVVQTADRWRALDRDGTTACTQAAAILRRLGERDLAWDYATTPAGIKPRKAEPWQALAVSLRQGGDLELADRAYQAAAETEPTNPQHLWDRAENLGRLGKTVEAQAILRRIAEGTWQPRFQSVQNQAKARLQ